MEKAKIHRGKPMNTSPVPKNPKNTSKSLKAQKHNVAKGFENY